LVCIVHHMLMAKWAGTESRAPDESRERGAVSIGGNGRFGEIVNRLLDAKGHKTVVRGHRAELVGGMRRFDIQSFYGDASRPDLLAAAGLQEASALVVAIDDQEQALAIVEYARRERPDIRIIARAYDRQHVYRLYKAGADDIVRETFDSALRAGKYALKSLGEHPFRVEKAARRFYDHDRESIAQLARVWKPELSVFENQSYLDLARERTRMMYEAMEAIDADGPSRQERAWTPPPRHSDADQTVEESNERKADKE